MSFINIFNKKNLLSLKKEISELPYNVFFETGPVYSPKKIQYHLKKANGLRKNLERSFDKEIYDNEKDKKAIGFWNLSNTTYLVIPTQGYLHISDFAKNGTEEEWIACWDVIKQKLKPKDYISITFGSIRLNYIYLFSKKK